MPQIDELWSGPDDAGFVWEFRFTAEGRDYDELYSTALIHLLDKHGQEIRCAGPDSKICRVDWWQARHALMLTLLRRDPENPDNGNKTICECGHETQKWFDGHSRWCPAYPITS